MIQAINLRLVEIQFKENESFWVVKINYTNAHFFMRTPVFQTTMYLYTLLTDKNQNLSVNSDNLCKYFIDVR